MWKTFKAIFQIFIVLTILLLIVLYFFINRLLKPLKRLNVQAQAIDNNEFIIEKKLPKTLEFRNVSQAMNKTISKMETIFNTEVKTLNKYNELFYRDVDTKLGNKNYLNLKLSSYLKNSRGILAFIGIKDEINFKKTIGFKDYFEFKTYVIELIKKEFSLNKDLVISKLDDNVLVVLLPNTFYEDIKVKFENIYNNTNSYATKNKLNEVFDLNVNIGIANYTQNMSLGKILSKTDEALSTCMKDNKLNINYIQEDVKFTKQQCVNLLQWVFENDGIEFLTQDVMNVQENTIYMKEYYSRLKDEKHTYSPADFLGTVLSMGWLSKLEKKILEKIFEQELSNKKEKNIVINLSVDFILDGGNINWLIDNLIQFNMSKTKFYFECINADVLLHLEEFKAFKNILSNTKHQFAIESFTFDGGNLEYLKALNPSYIKISKSYLLNSQSDVSNNILFNIASSIGTELIVKHVETKDEFLKLKDMNIKYLQGKYIDTLEVI